MSKAFDILSDMRNRKQDEADKLFNEVYDVFDAQGKGYTDIYQAGMKWATASGEAKALTEAIAELLKAGVI